MNPLKRILGTRIGRRMASPTVSLRQATDFGPTQTPAAPTAHAEPVLAPYVRIADMPSPVQEESAPARLVEDIAQLPAWRGVVPNIVSKSDHQSCVVLDLQMRVVLVLCTTEYFSSPAHVTLIHALSKDGWSVNEERTCVASLISDVHAAAESRKRPGSADAEQHNIQLYRDIMNGAYRLDASDIHLRLNLHTNQSTIRLRIDGKLRHWRTFDTEVLTNALAAAYNGMNIKGTNSSPAWNTERAINTITRHVHGAVTLHGRLSTQPTTAGCKVVIRVIDASEETLLDSSLAKLGFTEQQIQEDMMPALGRSKGFILISGSTGDGKTTTLQHMLACLPNREEKSLVGVEDPNEMEVPGMDHISLQRSPDDTQAQMRLKFDAALLQMLRMDPDVILQGEVRDLVSGEFASEAVMTGHLWAGTMHGNSAIGSIFRLIGHKIGIDPEILGAEDHFVASLAQKLVPRLCNHCKIPAADVMNPADLAILRTKFHLDPSAMSCAKTGGCEHCRRSPDMPSNGEKGRIAAVEIVSNPTQEFLECVRARDKRGAEMAWRKTRRSPFSSPDMRGKTSYEVALYWVSQGVVSPLALQDVFGEHFSSVKVLDQVLPVAVKEVA